MLCREPLFFFLANRKIEDAVEARKRAEKAREWTGNGLQENLCVFAGTQVEIAG